MKQVALININSKCINNGVQQEPPGPKPVKETGKLGLSSLHLSNLFNVDVHLLGHDRLLTQADHRHYHH